MRQDRKPYFVYPPVMALALYITVLGYMIPAIRNTFSLSLAEAGLFSTLQSAGTATSVILCFGVFSALNKPRIMAISSFMLAVSMLLMGVSEVLFLLYVLFFFIGLTSNIVDALSNAIIADIAPQKKSFHIGLVQALWAAAGAAGPFFALMMGSRFSPVFLGLGVITALISVVYTFGLRQEIRMPFMQRRENLGGLGKLFRTLKVKGIKLFVVISFFNAAVQMSMIFFLSSYVSELTGQYLIGAAALSAMFVGNIIGRFAYAKGLHRMPTYKTLPLLNFVALAAFSGMLFCTSPIFICVLAGIGGFGFSVNFPALIVELCTIVPDDTAAASALVFLGYTVACFAVPPVIGAIGDSAGLRAAMFAGTALFVFVIVFSWLLKRIVPTTEPNSVDFCQKSDGKSRVSQ